MKKTFKVYIISTLLSSIIFGIIVFSIMSGYSKGIRVFSNDKVIKEITASDEIKNLKGESLNIVTVLSDENDNFFSIVLLRIDKERGQSSITVFPKNTHIKDYGKTITLELIKEIEGDDGLVKYLHAICGLNIDKYIVLKGKDSVGAVADIVGPLHINIPSQIMCGDILLERGEQNISPDLIYDLLANSSNNTLVKTGFQYSFYKALFEKLFTGDSVTLINYLKQIVYQSDKTNIDFNNIDKNIDIFTHYAKFTVVDGMLSGKYRTQDNLEFFDVDCEATIEKFLPYRRSY